MVRFVLGSAQFGRLLRSAVLINQPYELQLLSMESKLCDITIVRSIWMCKGQH